MIKETDGDKFEAVRSLNQELTFEYTKTVFKSNNSTLNQAQHEQRKNKLHKPIYTCGVQY
jgi:ATP-dependent DNA helicase RecG